MAEKETPKIENDRIIFFLGAGASVTAGVPDTESFVYGDKGFKKRIDDEGSEEEKIVLQEILTILEEKEGEISRKYEELAQQNKDKKITEEFERIKREKEKFEKIDVELVLETLYKLNNKEVEILPDFYDKNTLKFKEKEESLKSLEKELRGFIREKTIVSEDKIDYLEPLKEFIGKYRTLDIFSVNYDTCIEQFCKEYSLRYTDGFELYWHPELFDGDYDVNHYKIHGSVMWYLTDRGTYVKIPIASNEEDEIELITGETAKTLMLYPMGGKWEYAEPLLELIRRLHVGLEKAGVCIVIGYSFRDDYIRRIFFEAAQKNKDLTIFLISPHAGKIYDDKLKFIDKDKRKPSPLEGRVICWNYPVKNVLKDLHQSLGTLASIQTLSPEECVSKCIEIGYTTKAEDILDKELGITLDNLKESPLFVDEHNDKLRLYCGLGVNHLYSGHYDKAKRYFKELKSVLEQSLEVGKQYFDLHRQSTSLNESLDEERKEINSKLKGIEDKYRHLPFYKWFMQPIGSNWNRRLQNDFIDFLNEYLKHRYTAKKDRIHGILTEIIDRCQDMKKCLEIPFKVGSDTIRIYAGMRQEIARKEEAEKKLKRILKAFDKLIDFCESQ